MITDSRPSRRRRAFRIALALSLLLHGAVGAFYGYLPLPKFFHTPRARPTPEQFVTISDAVTIRKKAVVEPPQHRARPHPATPPQPATVARVPVPPAVPPAAAPPPVARPTVPPPPPRRRHELTRNDPHAPAQARAPVVALVPPNRVPTARPFTPVPATERPTLPPETAPPATRAPATSAPATVPQPARPHPTKPVKPQTVALVPPSHPGRPTHARLTPDEIARIDSDLSKSIAQQRKEENPLRVPQSQAAAPRRYRMSVDSVHIGQLQSGEGTYWQVGPLVRDAAGYDTYRCAYAFQWADGTFEQGVVPWPVRFPPADDPFLHPRFSAVGLPAPPPGFQVAAGVTVGRALRYAFPGRIGP